MKLKSNAMDIQDMIGSLPEAILTHILSFLSTKESVATSVLSTRWRNLFTFVPVLDFHVPLLHPKPEEFLIFVNRVLSLHDVSCTIRMFRVDMSYYPCDNYHVSSWISAAIRRHAQIIDVYAPNHGSLDFTLPNDLLTCQGLVDLKLCGRFVFDVTSPVSLPSLKTIRIAGCIFRNGDSIKRLFSSCPVLEKLCLSYCVTGKRSVISISIPSLKHLAISCGYISTSEWELKNVANLETINLAGNMHTTKWYSVNILKSLRLASIMILGGENNDMIKELLNKFEGVQILSLSGNSMESLARDSFSFPMFNKLTTLELTVNFSRAWKFSSILLERSPFLEHLTITFDGDSFSDCDLESVEINILLPKLIPLCFSRSLKKVQLPMFRGGKVEYEWLKYLLKNAKILEKLVVSVSLVDEGEDSAYLEKVRKNLLALPRDSKNCLIVVIEWGLNI